MVHGHREGSAMKLESMTLVYSQEEDSAGRDGISTQEITVEITDAGAGPYAVISTERWAIGSTDDEIAEFTREIRRRVAEVEAGEAPR